MRKAAAFAAAIVLSCGPSLAAELTSAEYRARLGAAAQRLEEAAAAGEAGKAMAREALAELPVRASVRQAKSDEIVAVENRRLLRALRQRVDRGPDGIARAAEMLRSLEQGASTVGSPAPAEARRALEEVLSGREFRVGWLARLRQRVTEWVATILGTLLSRLPEPDTSPLAGALRAVTYGLLAVVALVTIFLITRLVRALMPGRDRSLPAESEGEIGRLSCASWLVEAEEMLLAHEYRRALRAVHMAALMKLDESGLVAYEDSFTDGRFVRALRRQGRREAADALAGLNHLFAACWYGAAGAGPDEYRLARESWDRLEAVAVQ